MSGHTTLYLALITALALCGAACTSEPGGVNVPVDIPDASSQFDTTGLEPTSDTSPDTSSDPVYLQCPDGWQPNSTGEACAPICAPGTELNEAETGCVPVAVAPEPDVTSTPDVVEVPDVPGPVEDVPPSTPDVVDPPPEDSGGPVDPPEDVGGPVDPPEDAGGPVVIEELAIDLNINAISLSGLVNIEPVVTGGDVVLGVEFYVDGQSLWTDFIPPYSLVINTATYADGPHTITVYTADNSGQVANDETIITFDNSPPVFTKTIPAEGETVFYEDRPLTMELDTDDVNSVEFVRFRANGFLVGEFFNPPFYVQMAWDEVYVFEDQLPTTVNVRFFARDQLGLETEVTYNVEVHRRFAWDYENLGQIWSPAVAFQNGNIAYATATSANSGYFVVLNPEGELVWEYDLGSAGAVRTPIVHDPVHDRVLVSTLGGHVIAFNNGSGPAWDNNLSYPLASMAVHGSQVYALTIYGEIRVINTSNGTNAWSVGSITSASVFSRMAVDDNGRAYFGDSEGNLFAVTQEGVQWTKQTGEEVQGRPLITEDGRVFFGSADGFIYAQDADGGDLWKTDVGGELACNMQRDPESGDLFVLSGIKDMVRVEDETGEELWTSSLEGWVQGTGIARGDDGTLYAAGALGRVYAVEPEAGDVLWSLDLADESEDVTDEQFYAAPLLDGGKLYIGNENTFMYAVKLVAPPSAVE